MNKWGKFSILLLCMIFLSGCMSCWKYINKDDVKWKSSGLEAKLPRGWVKYNSPFHKLYLTKDGIFLQHIVIEYHKMDSDKEFPITKKSIKEDMLLQEIAELIVNEMSLTKDTFLNLKILENKPVKIDGMDAFRFEYTYNDEDFMKKRGIYYGFVLNKKFYSIEFFAAQQHYFEKDLPDFEWFMDNFRIVKKEG